MAQTLLSFWGKKPEPQPPETLEPVMEPIMESVSVPVPEPVPEPVPVTRPPKPTRIVTLKLDPVVLAQFEPKVHPFFKSRKYTAPKTAEKSFRSAKWSSRPISHAGRTASVPISRLKRREIGIIDPPAPFYANPPTLNMSCVAKARRHLVDTSPRTPFDFGRYERQMWCQKYAPQRVKQHIQPLKCREVAQWIKTQFGNLKKSRPTPGPRRRNNDFVADDDDFGDDSQFKPFLVVHGPPGSGKTTSVYTACGLFDALVIECNLTVKRSGPQLREMLNGIIESHVVHAQDDKWYHCAVLIDEADINLDQEASFWSTLKEFAYKTRRPIVFTSETLDLPKNVINADTAEFIAMDTPDPVQVVETTWKICTSEGFLIDKNELARLVILFNGDIRRTLVHLQFWLQMGVGGSLGGAEWFKKAHERGRVVSANNHFEVPIASTLANEPTELSELLEHAEATSRLESAAPGQPLGDLWNPYIRPHAPHPMDVYSFFECPTDTSQQLVCEMLPIMRDIARDDLERVRASAGFRATRRSLASFGLQRQVLENPEKVLATFDIDST